HDRVRAGGRPVGFVRRSLSSGRPGWDGSQRRNGRTSMDRWSVARLRRLPTALAALGALLAAGPAPAQEAYPARAVHLLVPFPPGGAVDIVARTISDELSKRWGQSIVVE